MLVCGVCFSKSRAGQIAVLYEVYLEATDQVAVILHQPKLLFPTKTNMAPPIEPEKAGTSGLGLWKSSRLHKLQVDIL